MYEKKAKNYVKKCPMCNKVFQTQRSDKIYCDFYCKDKAGEIKRNADKEKITKYDALIPFILALKKKNDDAAHGIMYMEALNDVLEFLEGNMTRKRIK